MEVMQKGQKRQRSESPPGKAASTSEVTKPETAAGKNFRTALTRVGPAPAGKKFRTALLATDSVGKTNKKWFTPKVCQERRWVTPIQGNGYSLDELITLVLQHPHIRGNQQHDTLCIISMGNKYIGLNLHTWHADGWSLKAHQAIRKLAAHIDSKGVKRHLILYGGDVEMFRGPQFSNPARFPQDYADIQSQILLMLRQEGLNCGTGMEAANGDYGQWRGKLDSAMHIMGTYRAEAEQYMHTVLQKAEESATDMGDKDSDEWELISAASEDAYSAAPEDESDSEMADVSPSSASSGSKRKVDQMPGSSGTPGPPWKRTASGQNNNSHRQE